MIKIIKYFFEALLVYSFFIFSKLIGIKLSRKISSNLFIFFGPLIKKNNIIKNNLKKFPSNLSKEDEKDLINKMWSNYGMTFVEYIYLRKFRNSSSHITIKGEKILNEVFSKNKPVIFISGHFANFELMSMEITKKSIKLATIYRPLNNFFLNPFMEYLRKKFICKNQIKKGRSGVRESIEHIQKKNSIALMIDQRVSEGEKINFFNQEALTTTLPAQLALKFKLDIVPIHIERKKNDFFEMEILEPININNYKNKLDISIKLNLILEKMIIKNPSQWIWTHNRWK